MHCNIETLEKSENVIRFFLLHFHTQSNLNASDSTICKSYLPGVIITVKTSCILNLTSYGSGIRRITLLKTLFLQAFAI